MVQAWVDRSILILPNLSCIIQSVIWASHSVLLTETDQRRGVDQEQTAFMSDVDLHSPEVINDPKR